jgi:hypothetical protein
MSEAARALTDPGILATVTLAAVFAVAAFARWRGYDRNSPLLRAIADWVPGVPPISIAIGALVAIPVVAWLEGATAGESPNPIAALVFMVLLTVAATVVLLARRGAVSARTRTTVVGGVLVVLLLLSAVVSPTLRASLGGVLIGMSSLLVAAGIAYLYTRTRPGPRA